MGFCFPMAAELEGPAQEDRPTSLHGLKRWMKECINKYDRRTVGDSSRSFSSTSGTPPIDGRMYVASSVGYKGEEGFVQTGSSPSYFGGLWTLACCKKPMRREEGFTKLFEEPYDDGVLYPKTPIFIFTCASSSRDKGHPDEAEARRNWLASVAMVTQGFWSMEDYGRYLQEHMSSEAVNRRLTGVTTTPESERDIARRKGDCHIDNNGNVCAPPPEHDHGDGGHESDCGCLGNSEGNDPLDYEDNKEDHVKCLSEPGFWVSWTQPEFASVRHRLYQSELPIQSYEDIEVQLVSVNLSSSEA